MLADPGNIATNAAAAGARPCLKVEIQWDGANWLDETAISGVNYVVSASGSSQILDPVQGFMSLGSAPLGQATVVVRNTTSRYSEGKAGSQAASCPLYGKGLRISAGYYDGATARYVYVFTGRVVGVEEAENGAEATLRCHDMGSAYIQQRATNTMSANQQTSTWLGTLASMAGITYQSIETGYCIIPWCYLDDDAILDDMRRAAASEGGIVFFDVLGQLHFWNAAHWIGAASVATITVASFADMQPQRNYENIYNMINCEYQPRQKGQVKVVYSLKRPVAVPINGTKKITCNFQWPLATFATYTLKACTAGGSDLSTAVTPAPTPPDGAQRWTVTFTNASTLHEAFITRFDVIGYPLEGRPAETYEKDNHGSATKRLQRMSGNPYIQTEEQACTVADMLAERLDTVLLAMSTQDMRANPLLELGDVITVNTASQITGLNTTAIVTGINWTFGDAFTMSLNLSDTTNLYTYTGYLKVGTTVLNSGKLFY